MGYSDAYLGGYGAGDAPRPGIDPEVIVAWSPTTNPLETPVWVPIAGWRSIQTNRGRQNELDQIQAGTASVVLDNRDRRFDPLHTAGAYHGNVLPMKRFMIQGAQGGVIHDVFQGFVESWNQSYVNPNDGTVEVRLIDFFEVLNNALLPESVYLIEVAADSPTRWWRLGEPVGATAGLNVAGAASGGQPALSYEGGVTLGAAGAIANDPSTAVTLDGSTGFLTAGGGSAITAFPYSIELWLKISERTTTGNYFFFAQSRNGTGAAPQGYVKGTDVGPDTGKLVFDSVTSTVRVDDNEWHHVVLTASSSGAGAQTLWIDGLSQGTGTPTALGGNELLFGYPYIPAFFAVSRNYWPGSIDEIAIYNTALGSPQIQTHLNAALNPRGGETTDERVGYVLDWMEIDAADRDIDTSNTVLQDAVLGGSVLAHLQAINDVEQGLLFIGKDGKVRFRSRHGGFNIATSGTFGDGPGELRYSDISFDYSKQMVYNVVRRQQRDGEVMEVSDATSIARYGRRVDEKLSLVGASDLDALDLANYRLGKAKDPVVRISTIEVNPEHTPAALYPQVLGRELGDTLTINRRPQAVGDPISFDARLEGIAHTITPDSWVTTFRLSPADTALYLRLNLTSGPGLGSLKLAY